MHERHGRQRIAAVLALATVAAMLPASSALAGSRLINFDDATDAPCNFLNTTPLTTRYSASMGVTFAGPAPGKGGAILDECGNFGVTGYSPKKFLAFNVGLTGAGQDYPDPPETITFANPIHTFEIKAGQNGSGGTFTITGFDGTTPVSVNSRNSTAALSPLTLAATRMTSVKLEYVPGTVDYMIFDDMKFGTAPIAGDESFEVTQGQVLNVGAPGVLGNDSDPDGDALTPTISRQPGSGSVDLRPDGSFTYTPSAAFFGTDSFAYRDNDGTGVGNDATVTIKVNQLPPPPPPPPPLKTPAVTISFALAKNPGRVSIFKLLQLKNIPKSSRVRVVCLTKKGKRCKGKLKTSVLVKKTTKGTLRLKKLQKKRYPAGSRIDATITNPKFKTQYKTLVIRKNSNPSIVTRCSTPPSTKRRAC